jgi:tetratricopeptide (TPR) repeat protein
MSTKPAGTNSTLPRIALVAALAAAAPVAVRAESAGARNREGNRLFRQGQYVEAEKAYLEAQGRAPERPELQYNLGNALLRQKKYEPALQSLRNAITHGDRGVAASSWFNSGNARFETGDYAEAVDAYIQALRLNPADRDAKYNLELARRRLDASPKPPPQPNPKEGKDSKDPKPSDPGRQEPKPQPGSSQAGAKGGNSQPPPGERPGEESAPGKEQEKAAAGEASRAEHRAGHLSREQALQILDALQNQEIAEQRKRLSERERRSIRGKDW